jgi:hypothetical protein
LSPAASATKYIRNVELPIALERKRTGQALVYFVLVRAYTVEAAIRQYQILPDLDRAIKSMPDRDKAFADIVALISEDLKSRLWRQKTAVPAISAVSLVSDDLPFLCDRLPHSAAIAKPLSAGIRRPVVAIVPGPYEEAHDGFLLRLARYSLTAPVASHRLEWRLEVTPDLLTYELGDRFGLQSFDRDFINRRLPAGLTLLTMIAPCDQWGGDQLRLLKAFLAYWNGWPNLTSERRLCVCISIPWTTRGPSQSDLQKALPQSDYAGLQLAVAPVLDSPNKSHVSAWLTLPHVQAVYNPGCFLQLNRSIEALFHECDAIPMIPLQADLLRLLREHPTTPHAHST